MVVAVSVRAANRCFSKRCALCKKLLMVTKNGRQKKMTMISLAVSAF